jgi:hypothetical protein
MPVSFYLFPVEYAESITAGPKSLARVVKQDNAGKNTLSLDSVAV